MSKKPNTPPLQPVPADGKCTHCGNNCFTLAEDSTTYTPGYFFHNGKVHGDGSGSTTQESAEDEAVRFFCDQCGTRYAVPKELLK